MELESLVKKISFIYSSLLLELTVKKLLDSIYKMNI